MEEASPARQGEWLGRPKAQTMFIKSPGKKIYAVFKEKKHCSLCAINPSNHLWFRNAPCFYTALDLGGGFRTRHLDQIRNLPTNWGGGGQGIPHGDRAQNREG